MEDGLGGRADVSAVTSRGTVAIVQKKMVVAKSGMMVVLVRAVSG